MKDKNQKSENQVYVLICLAVIFVLIKENVFYAVAIGACLWALAEIAFKVIRKNRRLVEMRNRATNMYVVGKHPDNRYMIVMERHEGKFQAVPHTKVVATVGDLKRELSEAGNDKGKPDKSGVRAPVDVTGYIFGFGENAGETWEEYLARVEAAIWDDMRSQHKREATNDDKFYTEVVSGQQIENGGFEWPGKKLFTKKIKP